MKKLLFATVFGALAFVSCQKDDRQQSPATKQESTKYPVRFEVSAFRKTVEELPDGARKTTSSAKDMNFVNRFSYLYYFVFDGENKLKQVLQQKSTAGNEFGEITDSLPAGNYGFLFVASGVALNINSATKSGTFVQLPAVGSDQIDISNNIYYFYEDRQISNGVSAPIDVTVKRAFSFLKVVVEDFDDIINEGNMISARLKNANDKFSFYSQQTGDGNKFIDMMMFGNNFGTEVFKPSNANYEVEIVAKNASTNIIAYSKKISNIGFGTNQQVTYTGKLKGNAPGTGNESKFSLVVSDAYDADTTFTW